MTSAVGEGPALTPLWALTLGAASGAGATLGLPTIGPGWTTMAVVTTGLVVLVVAARRRTIAVAFGWFALGLALAGGHGLVQRTNRHALDRLIDTEEPAWVRARLVVTDGWSLGRWGWHTRVDVLDARHESRRVPRLSRCRLEVRGDAGAGELPVPGEVVDALVSIRGDPRSPLLVATSRRLVRPTDTSRPIPALRDFLARRVVGAAGTDVARLRAAELAAALALGRRDLMPRSRRDGWRRSGMAHVLAVSGLHVGLVAGMTWLALAFFGVSPTTSRIVILVVLPCYAVLAGASPSAVRAALMGVIYVGARLLGRAILPMAAVLLAATLLLIADPSLIGEVSFQLTVVLTAALVRWAPAWVAVLPLPRWLAAAIAVPVIAQLAAAPLVAVHFTSVIPGAAAANLLVPWLLGPVVVTSVAATAVAPLSTTAAGPVLDLTGVAGRLLWFAGAPGRWTELVPPPLPVALMVVLVIAGLLALLPGRKVGMAGAAAYVLCLSCGAVWWLAAPRPSRTAIELLPVSHGLAIVVATPRGDLLMDGGGRLREAAELLGRARIHRLAAVIASHADEDHVGGLETVLRTTRVDTLVVPAWLTRSAEAVPLLRAARRRGVRLLQVVRGSALTLGGTEIEVLWPPPRRPPRDDNERSLVARLRLGDGTAILTADIGRTAERVLAATTNLESDVVVIPHHGSRHSATPEFLDASGARFALIPAGPENTHNHPHPSVLHRLDELGVDYRMPIRDGRCGARLENGRWELYPDAASGRR